MRSFALFSSFVLSFALFQLVAARVTNQQKRVHRKDTSPNVVFNFVRDLFGLKSRQEQVCVEDDFYQQVQAYPDAQRFCRGFLGVSPDVIVAHTAPVTTVTDTYTTIVTTTTNTVRTTPVTTITATAVAKNKRSNAGSVARFMRVAEASGTVTADSTFISSISSACSCLPVTPLTYTVTSTDDATTSTQRVHVNTVQIINTTVTAKVASVTVTSLLPAQTSSGVVASLTTISSASASPTPVSPAIVCPNDDNTIDSQLIDGQLFQYLVQCDTDITDNNLAQYHYQTFTECAAACGSANYGFSSVVCFGAVFYPDAKTGSNCFLKKSANSTVVAGGVDAVILQRIEVAVSNSTTPSAVYSPSPKSSQVDTSSMLSSILQNSSTSIPIITPAPSVSNGRLATSYSTYISVGSTYSSARVYSEYQSSNGSWYETDSTSYSVVWSASSTQEVSYSTSSSSSSDSSGESSGGASGGATNGSGGSSGNSSSGNSTAVGGGSDGGAAGGGGSGSSSNSYTTTTTVYNTTTYNGNQETQNETTVTTYTWSNGTSSSSTSTTITITTIGSSSGGTSGSSSNTSGGFSGSSGNSASGSSGHSSGNSSGSSGNSSGSAGGSSGGGMGGGTGGGIITNGTVIVTNSTIVTNNTISTNGTSGGANGGSNGGSEGGASGYVSTDIIVSTIYSTAVSTVYLTATPPFSGSESNAPRSGTASPKTSGPVTSTPVAFPNVTTILTSIPLFNSSSGAYMPPSITAPPSGIPSVSANTSDTASAPFSGSSSGGNRSGTRSPVVTPYTMSNASLPVGPTGTAPNTFSGSFPNDNRTGSQGLPSATPLANSSTVAIPLSTGVSDTNSTSVKTSASFPFPILNSTASGPTGTAPAALFPFPTANSSLVTGSTGTAPRPSFPTPIGKSSVAPGNPFVPSFTGGPRSGTLSPSGPSSKFPSFANSTCTEMAPSTVTMFSTVTEAATTVYLTTTLLGCYPSCPQNNYGGGGNYGPFNPNAVQSRAR